jgi:hypothetical protein
MSEMIRAIFPKIFALIIAPLKMAIDVNAI